MSSLTNKRWTPTLKLHSYATQLKNVIHTKVSDNDARRRWLKYILVHVRWTRNVLLHKPHTLVDSTWKLNGTSWELKKNKEPKEPVSLSCPVLVS